MGSYIKGEWVRRKLTNINLYIAIAFYDIQMNYGFYSPTIDRNIVPLGKFDISAALQYHATHATSLIPGIAALALAKNTRVLIGVRTSAAYCMLEWPCLRTAIDSSQDGRGTHRYFAPLRFTKCSP